MFILGVIIAVLLIVLVYFIVKIENIKNTLWWVPKAPSYPILGNALDFSDSTKSFETMRNYALKYNGLCYVELLMRPVILIADHKLLEWLLMSNTLITKSPDYASLENWLQGGLLISDGAAWKKSRKILTPAFHFSILEQFVDVFEDPTSVFIDRLKNEVGKDSFNIYPYITKYTLDVICRTSMGIQLQIQEESHNSYSEAVDGMCKIVVERAFNPLKMFDFLYYLTADYRREKKYVNLLHEVSDKVIETRKKELDNKKENTDVTKTDSKRKMAFLDILLSYRDENGQPLSHDFIRHEVDTFLFAGHDTTASAISFAVYCLASHPEIQELALAEIREVLQDKTKITYRDLQDMKYLELVVKETLRLYPSVPFYSRQTTTEVVYEGDKIIPKGVTLVTLAFAVNRDPSVYDKPDEFIPTRFLNTNVKPFSYLPFSAGPRNCIGQKFAMLEMKTALSKLLLNYEILPAIPEQKLILAAETVLKSQNGINIRLKTRQ